ncbi:MAG: peptidoglycan-binding domain-containing protein [Pseudomonadota bacterium]
MPPPPPPPIYTYPTYWGSPFWYPSWGWYFTASVASATLVYVATLPTEKGCEEVRSGSETLYACDGVLYRPTYYEDERVYEIVSDPDTSSEPQSVVGLSLTDPMTRGAVVRDLQNTLVDLGYDVGGVDGIFGSGTETALLWFQYDNGLEQSGAVDNPTAVALGFLPPPTPAPEPAPPDPDPDPTAAPTAPTSEEPESQEESAVPDPATTEATEETEEDPEPVAE